MANSAVVGILRAILTADTAQFETAMAGASRSASKMSKEWGNVGRQAQNIGAGLTKAFTLPIVGIGAASIKAGIDFENSFAGVGKTVAGVMTAGGDLTEFGAQLAGQFRELAKEIPISVNELNRIGEAAGQLGVSKDGLVEFTRTMAQLGVATNLSSEEAATSLARLANITGMSEDNFGRLGSTIVGLGNNFATTESEIVEFGLRIAGAGKQAGLAESDILAIGTAMSSVGVEAEAGGTAVQKVLLSMVEAVTQGGKTLETFAATAGLSAEQFQDAFEQDASGAFLAFVEGLGAQGQQAIGTLDELGLADQRLIRSFLALSGAGDLLRETLRTSGTEWERNTALTEEAQKRFATTSSQLALLWSRVTDVGIVMSNAMAPAIDLAIRAADTFIPVLESLADGFAAMPKPLQLTIVGLGGVAAAAGPVLFIGGQLVTSAAAIVGAFGATGIATSALAAVMPALGAAVAALTGPIGLALGAIVGLGVAWAVWGDDIAAVVTSTYGAVKEWLWDKLEPVLTPIGGLLESVGQMFVAFGNLVGAVAEKTYSVTSSWLGEKLSAAFEGLATVVQSVVGTIGGWLSKIPDSLLPLLGPIGAVVLAFRHWDAIVQIAKGIYQGVKTWMLDKFTDVVNGIKAKVDAVTGFFEDMYDKVVGNSFVPDMINAIRAEFARLPDVMERPVEVSTAAVSGAFASLSTSVTGIVGDLGGKLQQKFGAFGGLLQGPLDTIQGFVGGKFSELSEKATSKFSTMFSGITGKFTEWGGKVEGLVGNAIGGPFGKSLGGLTGQLVGGISGILTGGLSSLFQMAMPYVMDGMKKLGELIWKGVQKFGSWIGGLFKSEGAKTNDTRDKWMDSLGGLEGAHALIGQHSNDPLLKAAFEQAYYAGNRDDFSAGMEAFNARLGELELPSLDVGGYVLEDGLAMVHAGETVVPAKADVGWKGGQNGDVHVHIHGAIDGPSVQRVVASREFAEELGRAISYNTFGIGTAVRLAT